MSARVLTWRDVPALTGAGLLGHTWVSIVPDADYDSGWRCYAQASSGASAVRLTESWKLGEDGEWCEPETPREARYFERARNGWREIPRRAAVLDGQP